MQHTSRTALLTVAVATAVGATVLTSPAKADHGGGLSSHALAALRLPAPVVTKDFSICLTRDPSTGKGTNCHTLPTGISASSLSLRVDYTLVRSETHVPAFEAVAGMVPATWCDSDAPLTDADRPGVRLVLTGASYKSGSAVTVALKNGEAEELHHFTTPGNGVDPTPELAPTVCPG